MQDIEDPKLYPEVCVWRSRIIKAPRLVDASSNERKLDVLFPGRRERYRAYRFGSGRGEGIGFEISQENFRKRVMAAPRVDVDEE